jgi:hypothetical protein
MNLGLEPIELTILRTMRAAPDQGFTAKRLCDVVYPVTIKKRHSRNAMIGPAYGLPN